MRGLVTVLLVVVVLLASVMTYTLVELRRLRRQVADYRQMLMLFVRGGQPSGDNTPPPGKRFRVIRNGAAGVAAIAATLAAWMRTHPVPTRGAAVVFAASAIVVAVSMPLGISTAPHPIRPRRPATSQTSSPRLGVSGSPQASRATAPVATGQVVDVAQTKGSAPRRLPRAPSRSAVTSTPTSTAALPSTTAASTTETSAPGSCLVEIDVSSVLDACVG